MEDRRIKRTRRCLKMALGEILVEKPVHEITVRELAERSGVNRATFYRHYRDMLDLRQQTERELLAEFTLALELEPPPVDEGALERLYRRIFAFVSEHAELCGILFGPNGDRRTLQRLENQVMAYCGLQRGEENDEVERFLSTFLIAGFIGVVEQWLAEGMNAAPETLASHIIRATREGFSLGLCPPTRKTPAPRQA